MKKIFLLAFLPIFVFTTCKSPNVVNSTLQQDITTQHKNYDIRIMTYNVENLFDTKDDPEKEDGEFLPWGIKKWTYDRYLTKLKRIFKVISNISEWEYPGIIALTEIENGDVLEDLIHLTPLVESDYGIIHEESPDARGIDVAFLYRHSVFRPITHEKLPVTLSDDPHFKTRDILYIQGLINKNDTLHFFVTHFPSRLGGEAYSESKRVRAATVIRHKVDSILNINSMAKIIITGDFNDEPSNKSVEEALRGKSSLENARQGDLFNMMYEMHSKGYGTYKYQSQWNMLDQYIISPGLLDKTSNVYTNADGARIFQPDWLSVNDDAYPGLKPNRTYSGPNYIGGYSDHYPVYMDLYFKKDKKEEANKILGN
ncbi:MAG: hypothetical protein M9887_01590 [Chitinophagales bacterium]|nr:hypothetical protein [Chitinophagales bacterium]